MEVSPFAEEIRLKVLPLILDDVEDEVALKAIADTRKRFVEANANLIACGKLLDHLSGWYIPWRRRMKEAEKENSDAVPR